ncbi:hypothetical protein H2201_006806 [Coniosporium apollinis]|uniref:Urease accessory protein UreD n=2 Tax=Coniosporium TaxID=2810619 RepID=A0ABQ9NPB8_9PEZI|nr:hypothetical protein H2199_007171 [Cladosporium sp. JES 115]KAJ9660727.1 hypothetical protein H2201_006806 [Coniosporium apollinis]
MPHKHTRTKGQDVESYDLPPSTFAKPLPVTNRAQKSAIKSKKAPSKRKKAEHSEGYGRDDTPKAFARLMQFQATGKGPRGLDTGDKPKNKKRKRGQEVAEDAPENPEKPSVEMPKILPGERMSDFAARVDQALPVSGLARKGGNVAGVKERQTKTEKRLQKMYAEWRRDEARIREKEEEARELAEEEDDEQAVIFEDKTAELPAKGKKGKRKRLIGEQRDGDDDPWAVLQASREQPKGLHDVAQAPPQFKSLPTEKFKVRNGAKVSVGDVPNAAGSLRRREELGEARKSIIEQYRKLMESKRNGE